MKKLNLKQKITFALATGILYGIILMLLHYVFDLYTIRSVLFQSVFFMILFGIGFPFVLEKMAPKLLSKVTNPEMDENENIVYEDGANLFRGTWVAVGGKLFLTNKRLIFNSHKYNFQNGETSIALSEIIEISKRKTSRIIDNGIRIVTKDNSKYDLVVNNRDEWLKQLKEKK